MAGSAAQRELQMGMVPLPQPLAAVGTIPLVSPDPDTAGWPSMLHDATNPIFDSITTLNSDAALNLIRIYATNPGPPPAWSGLSLNCLGIPPGPPGPGGANIIVGNKDGTNRWLLMWPNTENENGGNSGSNATIHRYGDDGTDLDGTGGGGTFEIYRSTGQFWFKNGIILGQVGSLSPPVVFNILPPQATNSAGAASAGVPVGGLYLNGDALNVRTV